MSAVPGQNLDWSVFGRSKDLQARIFFTLGALIVYRIGTYIPLPGIDPKILAEIFAQQQGGVLGIFDMFAGGALGRMTIFALNIMPYISASIIMQLMSSVSPALAKIKKEGESGRKLINQYTRYLTVFLAALQGYGIAVGLEGLSGTGGYSAVVDAGLFFRATTVITLVGGTVFLMWLGEQITQRGIGNGISLMIYAGIVASLPSALSSTLELGRTGALSTLLIIALFVGSVAVVAFIVFVERAQRRLSVQYPQRQRGGRMTSGDSSHLPLKINTPGVIPPIFASSVLLLPLTITSFQIGSGDTSDWFTTISAMLGRGQPLFLILFMAMIVFFAFFYTAVVFNPEETADNLKRNGGFIPGIRPGSSTADYIDFVLTRLTAVGATYLVLVCLLPEILISQYAVPFYFGGTSLLIVVSVTMDTVTQIQSHMYAQQYSGLMKRQQDKFGKKGKK
ncbi:MAG: preprotein translocase subunit SecY [Alphaproteobacteria bacterium]|nr:preprotein translocase subunit SecY [Alphaproteobacteria bacterium]